MLLQSTGTNNQILLRLLMVLPIPIDQFNDADLQREQSVEKGQRNTRTEPHLCEVHHKTTAF